MIVEPDQLSEILLFYGPGGRKKRFIFLFASKILFDSEGGENAHPDLLGKDSPPSGKGILVRIESQRFNDLSVTRKGA